MPLLFFISHLITYKRFLLLWAVLGLLLTDTLVTLHYFNVCRYATYFLGFTAGFGFLYSLLLNKHGLRIQVSKYGILMILYLLLAFLSMILNGAVDIFYHLFRLLIPLGFGLLYGYLYTIKDLKSIIYGLTIFGLINVLMAYPLYGLSSISPDQYMPQSGFFNDRNGFARYLSIINVFFLIEFLQSKKSVKKFFDGVFILLIFGSVLIQFSRSGYIVYFISTAIVLFMTGSGKIRKTAAILLPIILLLFGSFTIARIKADKMSIVNASDIGRIYVFKAGINMIKAHPIKGIGYDMTPSRLKEFADNKLPGFNGLEAIHNGYVAIWAEMGIVTLIVFCVLNYMLMHNTMKQFLRLGFSEGKYFLFVFTAILILMIDALFLPNYDYENIYWIIVALGVIVLREIPSKVIT
jgi:O-antigen ligase